MITAIPTETEIQRRFIELDTSKTKEDTFTLSFSSETPVQRGFGLEVLSHAPDAANLERLNDSAPLLWSHDPTLQIGVVERAWIENGKGRAIVRWGNSELAKEKRADVESGIIRNVSIGYSIEELEENEKGQMVATRWTGLEVSLVSVPSDPNCGIGRSHPSYLSPKEMPKQQIQDLPVAEAISTDWQSSEYQAATRDFSMVKAIQASVSRDWSQAGLEREVNQELQHQTGKRTQGFLVPSNAWSKRAYVTSTTWN